MVELQDKLISILNTFDFLYCGAIIDELGSVRGRAGDFTKFERDGLSSAVLGPYGDPAGSYQLAAQHEADSRFLPQIISQGDFYALLHKCCPDLVVVVFGMKHEELTQQLRNQKDVTDKISFYFAPDLQPNV